MPSLFEYGDALLDLGAKVAQSRAVTYRRAALSTQVTLGVGAVDHEGYGNAEGANFTARMQDFVGLTADLAFDGEFFLPERGDEIDWTDEREVLHTYRVTPRDGERCYLYTSQTQVRLRIFTVEIQPSAE